MPLAPPVQITVEVDDTKHWQSQCHPSALQERFPKLLGDREIQASSGTDYAYRLFVPKQSRAKVLAHLAEETDYGNFKSTVHQHQGPPGKDYEKSLHDVWDVMHRLQK